VGQSCTSANEQVPIPAKWLADSGAMTMVYASTHALRVNILVLTIDVPPT
jgi:hypothetical protein